MGVLVMKHSQNAWVLRQLENGHRLSSRNAVIEYGIQDLPKRISELRTAGNRIESERVDYQYADGRRTHWNEYWMAS